ncbi:unnamed protein product [Rhizophagus irregularis]|nr:unnamed protein product [Rhizophagus irregularis]
MSLLFIIDIAICGTKELKILRCDLKANHVVAEKIDGCNNYILPNVTDYGVFRKNCLTFKVNKTIKFTKPDSGIAGYDQIGFYYYDNVTIAEAGTIGIASLTILIMSSDFNPVTNPNKAISQMDKATLSELKLQLNFIAGMIRFAAVVKTKNFYNYFPFNNNSNVIPAGTTGYFSVAAGSFTQEQTSEERSNTVLSAIAAAGGASGTTAAILIFFFGDFRLKPRGFAHTFHNFIQNSLSFIKRSRFYPEPELKFSGKDKKVLEDEFEKIRHAIYHHLLYQGNMDSKMNKDQKWSINRLGNKINILFNHWILDAENIKKEFEKYDNDRNRLEFSSINEEDKRLLNDEIDKIRHVIDVYTLGKKEDPKKIAAYKYERELKFSDNTISDDNQKLLNDEFRKIRELIDNHLLNQPNIEKIFNAYNSLRKNVFPIDIRDIDEGNTLQNNNLPEDMDVDKKLLNDVFHQISHVIFRHLLDIPEDEILFNKYKETVETSSFSTEMNDNDKKLIVNEFNRIKHAISQMDKATLSELKLQLNFIAGMIRFAAVVKTSTYRSILPGDSRAIFWAGTTGYFSVAAGSFTQEQTSEERSNTVLSAIAAAGGASGTTAAILIFFFGDFRLKPRGFAHTFHNFIQNSLSFIKRSRFYPEPELKFSGKDKKVLEDEFEKIRHAIYHHLLYQGNMDSKMNKDQKWSINRLGNKINILFNHWILDAENIKKEFEKYDNDRNRLEFSSINEEDKRLLNDEIDKIRHVIDVYTLGKKEDPKKIAAYKYERELKFSDNTISDDNQKLLNDEFRKIRELIDNHLLNQPNIEKIFNAYNSLRKNVFPIDIRDIDEGNTLQNNNLPEDMDVDKKLLNDVFHQISHVIFRHLLDIPEDEILFNKYKETVETSSFSTEMNDNDKKLIVNEFNRIKHVINSHLFNGRKILKIFKEYREKQELGFSNQMSENNKKLLNGKFREIRDIIDEFLLNKPHTYIRFSDRMDEEDRESLNNVLYNIRNDIDYIDKYVLDKV